MTSLSLPRRLSERSQYLRSPAESAHRQVRSFNLNVVESLLRMLKVNPTDRILLVGGSVGVLGSHLATVLNRSEQLYLSEPDRSYLEADVPESLFYESDVRRLESDPLNESFPPETFDRVVAYDFARWFTEEELLYWASEVNRLLGPEGDLIVLEDVGSRSWRPDSLRTPRDEETRADRLRDLVETLHSSVEPSFFRSPRKLVGQFHAMGWSIQSVRGWFQPFRLNDRQWTERQRTDFINLHHQAQRDRIQRVRRLMEHFGLWDDEHGPLFRQLASDYQQQSLRFRKALETDEETGWSGYETIVLRTGPS